MKIHLIAVTVALFCMLSGCSKTNRCNIPFGEAACELDLSMPSLSDLWNINGYIYLHGGNKGICVTHPSSNEFVAFERTCPYDQETAVVMRDDSDGLILECPTCGSRFLSIDGTPLEGSQTSCPLLQYCTAYDGAYRLQIW